MAQLGNGKSAFQDRKFILTAPVDSNGDPVYDGGIERGDTGDDITAQVVTALLSGGGTRVESGSNSSGSWLKVYTSDTSGVQVCWETRFINVPTTAGQHTVEWQFPLPYTAIPMILVSSGAQNSTIMGLLDYIASQEGGNNGNTPEKATIHYSFSGSNPNNFRPSILAIGTFED